MKIRFVEFVRPQGKERPRADKRSGRIYTPPTTVKLEKRIAKAALLAMAGAAPMLGPVKLTVIAIFAIPPSWPRHVRERAVRGQVWHVARSQLDLDNAIKLYSDAMSGIVYADDAQIAVITSGKRYGHPERVEIVVEQLDQEIGSETPGQVRQERERLLEAEAHRHARQRLGANASRTKS